MPDPSGQLFDPVVSAPVRSFVAERVVDLNPQRVVLPDVGRWEVASAVCSRFPAERLEASDVTLFSAIVGYLADPRLKLEHLHLVLPEHYVKFSDGVKSELDVGAAYLLALTYGSLKTTSAHRLEQRKAIWRSRLDIREWMARMLGEQVAAVRGVRYEVRDMRDVTAVVSLDGKPDDFLYVPLPGYADAYRKQFGEVERLFWPDRPGIAKLDKDEPASLMLGMSGSEALCMVYLHQDTLVQDGWTKVGAFASTGGTDYLVTNRPLDSRIAKPAKTPKGRELWPLYADEDITPESVISFVSVDKDTGLYYRDLLVHRLAGSTTAERYALMLVDGRVTTTFGLHLRDVVIRKTDYAGEVFGISITSDRYARLGKMFMLALTSMDFKRWMLHEFPMLQRCEPVGIQTPSPTQRHEGKTDRGVMRLERRVEREGGGYQLLYRVEFRDDTWPQVMADWHAKYAHITRAGYTGPRIERDAKVQVKRKRGRGSGSRPV